MYIGCSSLLALDKTTWKEKIHCCCCGCGFNIHLNFKALVLSIYKWFQGGFSGAQGSYSDIMYSFIIF